MSVTQTTLVKKIFMALTGLFLAFFLVIHLAGNLQLLLPEEIGRSQFNAYSHLLSGNIIIKLVSYVLYFSILYHVLDAALITHSNYRANAGSYKADNRGEVSSWISRNMGILGFIILFFLVIHFTEFSFMLSNINIHFAHFIQDNDSINLLLDRFLKIL